MSDSSNSQVPGKVQSVQAPLDAVKSTAIVTPAEAKSEAPVTVKSAETKTAAPATASAAAKPAEAKPVPPAATKPAEVKPVAPAGDKPVSTKPATPATTTPAAVVTEPAIASAGHLPQASASEVPPTRKERGKQFVQRMRCLVWRHKLLTLALLATLLSGMYWMLWASDRYVSEAHIVIERTNLAGGQTMDFTSLLSGTMSGARADQLLMRDYLRSKDMLAKLDGALRLRAHYSNRKHDALSRLWSSSAPAERFQEYFLSRVSIEFDDYTGVLVIRAQAYDAETARKIATFLMQEGEAYMNKTAQTLASSQVEFLQNQVNRLYDQALYTRQELVAYQNKHGLISPQASAENIATVVAKLEGQRIELEAQRRALMAYLVQDHASVVMLTQQIQALDRQIAQEKAKLASSRGVSLNKTVEEYQRLEMEAMFAQEVYKTALVALEKGRIEATRVLKQLTVLQMPHLPESSVEPRRIYNTVVYVLVIWLLAGVAVLLAAIVRDHRD